MPHRLDLEFRNGLNFLISFLVELSMCKFGLVSRPKQNRGYGSTSRSLIASKLSVIANKPVRNAWKSDSLRCVLVNSSLPYPPCF